MSTTWRPRSGAIVTILFAFSFLPQVVLFVGNMLVSDSALDYFTGHLDVLWKVPLAVLVLAVYYAVIGVAIASLTDRRIVAGASVIGLFLRHVDRVRACIVGDCRRASGSTAALINVLALPLYLRDIDLPRQHRPPTRRSAASPAVACSRSPVTLAVVARRTRRAVVALPMGGALMSCAMARHCPARPRPLADPAFVADATVEVDAVSVWFGAEGRAVASSAARSGRASPVCSARTVPARPR